MSFLQPLLLAALPLAALPIIIHLINQRRYQTMPWGAMMFLLAASRMSRGYARIRQWLILLFRALVIAALVFAISRPLASGWVGAAAGRAADTTIVLVDRSPSMQQRGDGSASSKLQTGTAQLAGALQTLGSSRIVMIENTTGEPRELESPAALLDLPQLGPADAAADLPAMMLAALDYIRANKLGQTDIWICSDLRENDWNATDGRWSSLREAFGEFDQRVRFHLLAYPQRAPDNRAIRVSSVRRQESSDGAEAFISISISLQLDRDEGEGIEETVPVEFDIEGARSVVHVDVRGTTAELKDHRIPITRGQTRGWGRVSIPADANPADNDFYFVFDIPPPRQTVIVTDDPAVSRPLELAAGIAPSAGVASAAEVIAPDALAAVAWEQVALVLWQAAVPQTNEAAMLQSFVDSGGQVIFFPPSAISSQPLFGMRWEKWNEPTSELTVQSWRGDTDLLSNTLSGASLPVGQLRVDRYVDLDGEGTALATLEDGTPLLVRVATPRGGVYFCTTTPLDEDSSLASNGVVLYVMVQRAIQAGAAALGNTHQQTAGEVSSDEAVAWTPLAGRDEGLSTEQAFHAGVYSADERLLAINRPSREDRPAVLSGQKVEALFGDLHLDRVDDRAGNLASLVQEIWRLFLIGMMVSMIVEAALCLPKKRAASPQLTERGTTA